MEHFGRLMQPATHPILFILQRRSIISQIQSFIMSMTIQLILILLVCLMSLSGSMDSRIQYEGTDPSNTFEDLDENHRVC